MFSLNMMLAAFGGGLFGAALGAIPAFVFAGFMVIAGETLATVGNQAVFTGAVGFGSWFGPHIGFGIAAASLIILQITGAAPVTHHIALPAAIAAYATGSLFMGGLFGILGALLGEFYARLFYDWGDTHIDPPACTIATLTTVAMLFLGY